MMLKRVYNQFLICLLCSLATLTSFTTASVGQTKQLYTSSVAYCSPPIAILVTDLSLRFYPENSTLEFDLSAASIQDNLNVSIALSVNAYGLGLFNVNIDLCSLAGGILCPLPKYQFSGGGIFPVPKQFSDQIPTIAYTIPDLEAVATLQLNDTSNNNVVGCVQATLSNGHTAKQSGVLWATVGLALLALFSSLLHTVIAQSIGAAQWRIVDVMWAIQNPAITSFLSLNYPTVFLSYGTNFAWSLGLVDIPSLQSSITQTRSNTGGHDQAVFGKNLTAEIGRKYNPFNGGESQSSGSSSGLGKSLSIGSLGFFKASDDMANKLSNFAQSVSPSILQPSSSHAQIYDPAKLSLLKRQQYAPNTGPGGSLITGGQGVALPLVSGDETSVNGGIGTFAERNYVAPSNAFLTVLVSMAILLAICVGALILTYLIAFSVRLLTDRRNKGKGLTRNLSHWSHRVTKPSEFFNTVILPTLGRYLLIVFPVFFIFAFWQWIDGDSWVGHLVAALMTVIILAFTAIMFVPMIIRARRSTSAVLYHDKAPAHGTKTAKRWGHLSHPYRQKFYWFSLALLLFAFIRACFISFAQQHGTRQAIGLLVTDVLLFLILCIFRVGRDKKSDFVLILLCFSRIAAWAVCVVFIPSANIRTIPRAIVAFVLLVVTALPIIYLFFLTVYDLFMPFLRRNRMDVDHYNSTDGEISRKSKRTNGKIND
ncbi:TRP-domain-containing protein [Meira miltonrushii]|uniref:TRP-domain-containing protein n=1 Tax=Meira miltonrushii TaxID=1280837 RepID=A0A316V1R5_9BASI|nr:TRP-domain-containing protein [Meira miltonrushii]PWN31490.1 TRP-domain-containing protein [Meira miltonrushii]